MLRKSTRVGVWPKVCEAWELVALRGQASDQFLPSASFYQAVLTLIFKLVWNSKNTEPSVIYTGAIIKRQISQKEYWLFSRLPGSFLWNLLNHSPFSQKGKLNLAKGECSAQDMIHCDQRQSSRKTFLTWGRRNVKATYPTYHRRTRSNM